MTRALEAAMVELDVNEATLVTLTAEERLSLPSGNVRIQPLWMWTLGIE